MLRCVLRPTGYQTGVIRNVTCSASASFSSFSLILKKNTSTAPKEEFTLQKYQPKVFSSEEIIKGPDSLIPINVELNYYAPIRHEPTHNDLVCELSLRSYDPENLDFFADFALRAGYYLNIPLSGVIPMKTRRERWTVIKSHFINAKVKENFERRTHKRLIRVYDAHPEVVDIWLSFLSKNAMPAVGVKANVYSQESIGVGKEMENVKLETARDDVPIPKYVHFGNNNNMMVAQRVQELLENPVFKKHLDKDKSVAKPDTTTTRTESTKANTSTSKKPKEASATKEHKPINSEAASDSSRNTKKSKPVETDSKTATVSKNATSSEVIKESKPTMVETVSEVKTTKPVETSTTSKKVESAEFKEVPPIKVEFVDESQPIKNSSKSPESIKESKPVETESNASTISDNSKSKEANKDATPLEVKPAVEAQSIESNPIEVKQNESKPIEPKRTPSNPNEPTHTESKPIESKPIIEVSETIDGESGPKIISTETTETKSKNKESVTKLNKVKDSTETS